MLRDNALIFCRGKLANCYPVNRKHTLILSMNKNKRGKKWMLNSLIVKLCLNAHEVYTLVVFSTISSLRPNLRLPHRLIWTTVANKIQMEVTTEKSYIKLETPIMKISTTLNPNPNLIMKTINIKIINNNSTTLPCHTKTRTKCHRTAACSPNQNKANISNQ